MELPRFPQPTCVLAALAFTIIVALTISTAGAGIGRTPGQASVSDEGEARYSIAIELPPAANGMVPALSLDYGHRTHGGLLGAGWSIGGLSVITRCARTVAQDGIAAAPRRANGDRLCLDGRRLVPLVQKPEQLGMPDEFRTEIESWTRIRAVAGPAASGPASFSAETADGLTYEYGATPDSRIDGIAGPAANSARSWALNRVRDRTGNVIDYRYTEEAGSLAVRLSSIAYGANPENGYAASHEVRFIYEARPNSDVDAGYVAGMPVREVMRLAAIEARHGSSILRRYELDYEPALSVGGRSRLATVRECGVGGSDCLAPTRFEWTEAGASFRAVVSAAAPETGLSALRNGQSWNIADLNGDGRGDFLWAAGSSRATATVRYRLSQRSGAFGAEVDSGILADEGIGVPFDADGDGNADLLIARRGSSFQIARGGPAGLGRPESAGIAAPVSLPDFRGADLNGDGLGDIAWSQQVGTQWRQLQVFASFARADGGYGSPVLLYSQYEARGNTTPQGGDFVGRPGQRIDFDGDGAEDLLMDEIYTFARISATEYGTESFDTTPWKPVVLDFNDDGCTDFAYLHINSQTVRVRPSQCIIEGSLADILGPDYSGLSDLVALDWNSDGRDDLLSKDAKNWRLAVSRADSASPFAATGVAHENSSGIAGVDLDGDALQDLAMLGAGQLRARFRKGPAPDLLRSVTDGFGVVASFKYAPLTETEVYQRGRDADWPDQTLSAGGVVVAELEESSRSGTGATVTSKFRYEGLRRNLQGRGSLGFSSVLRTEGTGDSQLESRLSRRQDFPFVGLPKAIALQSPGGPPISSMDFAWSKLETGASPLIRWFPWPSTVTTRHFELEGPRAGAEVWRTVSRVNAIDPESGLATDATTTTTEASGGANAGSSSSVRVLHSSVLNDTANWCLGRSQSVQITGSHTLARGDALIRQADEVWDTEACRPTRIRLQPGDAAAQVTYDLSYDAFGNLSGEKVTGNGMAARTLTTTWDERGRLPVRINDPLGQATRMSWGAGLGLPTSFTDPNGLTTRWEYDAFGRATRQTAPDGTATRWARAACDAGCSQRARYRLREEDLDTDGVVRVVTTFEKDAFDRVIRVLSQQPGGGRSVETFDFGERGELLRSGLPAWEGEVPVGYLEFSYDRLGRPTSERLVNQAGAQERATALSYDGLSATVTDALGRRTIATRLAWGPLVEVVDPLGGRTRYDYDAFGGLAEVRDAANKAVATISYDARGRKVAMEDADRGNWTWTRNSLGETTALRDAKGQVIRFEYDALGRVTKRTSPEGVASWAWGASSANKNVGRLTALSGPSYSESFTYDATGRPASHVVTAEGSHRFAYAYNSLGLLDALTYPAAGAGAPFRIRLAYDAGRLARIEDASAPATTLWSLNAVDAAGRVLDETLGAGIRVVTGYSPAGGEVEYRQTSTVDGVLQQDFAYRWDAVGNLAAREDLRQGLTEDFRYDALDRLLQSRRNDVVNLDLGYDSLGNITRKSDVCPGTTSCYGYHATKRHAVVSAAGQTYAYDANGNMTNRAGAGIAWNSDNLPVAIAGANGNSSGFAYGPEGNRWRHVAVAGGMSETTIYADGLFERATQGGRAVWRHYVPIPGGTAFLLRYDDGTPASMRFVVTDHLGSTDRVLSASGSLVVSESFDAFGKRRSLRWNGLPSAADLAKMAAATDDGFTGHEQLDNIDLVHMNGRVYDPFLGRFISADPYVTRLFDAQALNRYAYVLNNPLRYTDPSGFDPIPCATTPEGRCAQITVIAASWADYMRAVGGAHSSEIASALERDPCGQNGSAVACAMQTNRLVPASSILLGVGSRPDPGLANGGALDAIRGFAARAANVAISSSPIGMLFDADSDFEYFDVPRSNAGAGGARMGDAAMLVGGVAGVVRTGGSLIVTRGTSALARTFQGSLKYPGIDRFRDITLKKGTTVYAGFPGQSVFYTTASALRRSGGSAEKLWKGLQIASHESYPIRMRMASYEVLEDTPAAFSIVRANAKHGAGGYPQIVVPSFRESLRYLEDFALAP